MKKPDEALLIAERMAGHLGRALGTDAHLLQLDGRVQRDFTRAALELARAWYGFSGSPHDLAPIREAEARYALAHLRCLETVAELVEAGAE